MEKQQIWQFQRSVSRRLMWWAGLNVVLGLWLQQRRNKFWRGVGMQAVSWGAINAAIAGGGTFFARRRERYGDAPYSDPVLGREYTNLYRALWINAGLDIAYILGGMLLAWTRGSRDRLMRGNGWGIVMQGGFLFIFDVIHALIMSSDKDDED
ncbi:MAG: hypothetical protein AAF125_08955 [Chloroflexota bacterium]